MNVQASRPKIVAVVYVQLTNSRSPGESLGDCLVSRQEGTAMNLSNIKKAYFIKLGEKGAWEDYCLQQGELRLGFYEVPDDATDNEIRDAYPEKTKATTTKYINQIRNFYEADESVLFITFINGKLWWAQAGGPVRYLGMDKKQHPYGSRSRKTKNGWSSISLSGEELHMHNISGQLTDRIRRRPDTIFEIKDKSVDMLLDVIRGTQNAGITAYDEAKQNMISAITERLQHMRPKPFETLVEKLFNKAGWLTRGQAGGSLKTIDLDLWHPLLNKRAIVQIKTQTTQAEFDKYANDFKQWDMDEGYFVYHSTKKTIQNNTQHMKLIDGDEISKLVLEYGLLYEIENIL